MTRITQQQLESYLWGAAVLLRGTIDAGDYKQFIFPMLFYKRICDVYDEEAQSALNESGGDVDFAQFPENHRFQVPADAHWNEMRKVNRDVGRALQHSMRAIETANPDKLYGIFGDAQWTNKERLSDAMLRDLIEHFSTLELTVANLPEDELGQGYEYLIKKFADDSGHTAAEFYTNRTVVHLMTEMLDVQPGESVYDPTCGSGGMLLSCISHLRNQKKEWRNVKLYGQERNLMTSSIARMNCFLHGIEDFRIERGDTLAEPKLVEGDRLMRFDVVLANPPYSIKQWDRDAFASDPWGRNLYGTPPQGRADYAFQQHILQSLKPDTGRCAVLWPHGILFRNEEDEIRRKFIESDYIEAVIGLGPNLFYNSSMQSCIMVCRTSKPPKQRKKILFIDASNEVTRERAQSFLAPEHLEKVLSAYRNFESVAGFATAATLEEIKSNDWSLNIPLYVKATANDAEPTTSEAGNNPGASLHAWIDSSGAVRSALTSLIPDLAGSATLNFHPSTERFIQSLDRKSWRKIRLAEVCDEISIRVNKPAESGLERFVGLEHFDSGELKIRRWGTPENLESSMKAFASGDVLFARRNAYLKRASLADFDGLCSGDAIVLRENHDVIVPGFLAFVLNTTRFWDFAIANAAGTMSRRVNGKTLMRYEFDLPPLDQQRRIAEILWAVDEERQGWLKTKAAAEQVHDTFVERSLAEFEGKSRRVRLGEMIQKERPLCYGIVQPGEVSSDGTPFIRVCDMEGGNVDVASLMRVSDSVNRQYRRSTVSTGDVLVSIVGTIGRVAIVGPECEGFNIARAVARIAPSEDIRSDFLAFLLRATSTQRRLVGSSFETARKTLNLSALEVLEFPLPDKKQQSAFMNELSVLHEALVALTTRLEASNKLQLSIANQVFS